MSNCPVAAYIKLSSSKLCEFELVCVTVKVDMRSHGLTFTRTAYQYSLLYLALVSQLALGMYPDEHFRHQRAKIENPSSSSNFLSGLCVYLISGEFAGS